MSYNALPTNYSEVARIDMKTNRRLAINLNLASIVIFLLVVVISHFIKPIPYGLKMGPLQLGAMIILPILYLILHELIHALFMRIFVKGRLVLGMTIWAAFAGMPSGYFSKKNYIIIALAPVVISLFVISIGLIIITTPIDDNLNAWYWPLIFVQAMNIGGSIGDYYVVAKVLKMSRHVLTNDDGMSMRFYEPNQRS